MSKLNDFVTKIKSMIEKRPLFDPTVFNDPIASQTEWTPRKRGGANFKTHNFAQINSGRVEFKVSIGAKIFYSVFLLFGIVFMFVLAIPNIEKYNYNFGLVDVWMPLILSSVFIIVGLLLFYFGNRPIVFDRGSGYYWKGWKNPNRGVNKAEINNLVKLKDIHAIQIISEYVRGNKTSYTSYELNLVLKDASRVNVVDHGNRKALIEDAEKLSRFLDKPLWNPLNI